jgi:hypothetical protein
MVGNCFTNSCPEWREGTYENFQQWAANQFGAKDQDSDDEEEVPVHFKKAKDLTFEKNDDDEFILPHISDFKTIRQKQRVVRGYIGAVYSMFSHPISIFLSHSNYRGVHWKLHSVIPLHHGFKG